MNTATDPRPIAGLLGLALGATAFVLVALQFFAGPFAPQQDVAVTIGETAVRIWESAQRARAGLPQPAPEAADWDIDRILLVTAAILAGVAMVAGTLALFRREAAQPATGAIVLGLGAVLFQFFTWAVLLVCGVILLVAIVNNIGDILGGFGG